MDIKQAEAKLKDTLDNLDKLVKERTAELQKAYDSLKKSEKNLAEAQEIAHIGSWERDFASNEYNWSDRSWRVFSIRPLLLNSHMRLRACSGDSPSSCIAEAIILAIPMPAEPAPKKNTRWFLRFWLVMRMAFNNPATVTLPVPWMSSLKQQTFS